MFLKSDINWEQLFEASVGAAADQPSQWRGYVIKARKCCKPDVIMQVIRTMCW